MSENLVEKYATKTYIDKDYKDICIREDTYLEMLDKVNKYNDIQDTLKDREEYCDKLEEDRENILIENKKQKEVLDKIKEYIKENAYWCQETEDGDIVAGKILNEDNVTDLEELLEEIE